MIFFVNYFPSPTTYKTRSNSYFPPFSCRSSMRDTPGQVLLPRFYVLIPITLLPKPIEYILYHHNLDSI